MEKQSLMVADMAIRAKADMQAQSALLDVISMYPTSYQSLPGTDAHPAGIKAGCGGGVHIGRPAAACRDEWRLCGGDEAAAIVGATDRGG